MRLTLLPIVGFKNIQGESDYILYQNMALDFPRLGRPVYSYMCLPRIAFGQAHNESGVSNLYIEGPTDVRDRGGFHDMLAVSSQTFLDLFAPRNCRYPVDVMITSRTDAVPSLARWLWDWRSGREVVPIIIMEPQICNIPIVERNETWLLTRTLGYLMGWPVFNTEHEKALALETAMKYLRPALVRKLEQRARVIAVPVSFDDMDRVMQRTKRAEKFTLFSGGRLNQAKRADKMLQLYDEFYRAGRDIEIVVCSPKGEARVEVPPQVKFYRDLRRPDFLKQAAQAHVYLNTSKAEGFSAGFVEQVYMVPVSIVPDLPWVRSILGDVFDHHPFVYRDFDQARAFLRYVYDNYEAAAQRLKPVREYLRQRYGGGQVASQIMGIIDEVVRDCQSDVTFSDSQTDLLWRAYNSLGERFTFSTFWGRYRDKSVAATEVPQLGELWKWQAYIWLSQRALDPCSGPDVEFVKNA